MATAYGGIVTKKYNGYTAKWRVAFTYDVIVNNDTTYGVRVYSTYYERTGGTTGSMGQVGNYSYTQFWDSQGALYATNGATSWKLTGTGDTHTKWTNVDVYWSKTTYAYTAGIYLYGQFSSSSAWSGSSQAEAYFTVPAKTSYSVSYNANAPESGKAVTNIPGNQTKWINDNLGLSATVPQCEGWRFLKWNTAAGSTGTDYAPGATYTANAGTTLYAQWEPYVSTVTFMDGSTVLSTAQAPYLETFNFATKSPQNPTKAGYVFLGWSKTPLGDAERYKDTVLPAKSIANDTSYYAVWTANYIPLGYSQESVRAYRVDKTLEIESDTGTNIGVSINIVLGKTVACNATEASHNIVLTDVNLTNFKVYVSETETWGTAIFNTSSIAAGTTEFDYQIIDSRSDYLDVDKYYNVKIEVSDSRTSVTAYSFVTKAQFIMDINEEGSAISFFGTAPDDSEIGEGKTYPNKSLFINGDIYVDDSELRELYERIFGGG